MGLFSRKDSSSPRKPVVGRPRPSVSSEAQAAEMRVRARRRLAGSVVLILTAIVVLPMLLDSEQVPVANNIAIKIPDRNSQFQANLSEPTANASPSSSDSVSGDVKSSASAAPSAAPETVPPPVAAPVAAKTESKPRTDAKTEAKPDAKSDPKQNAKKQTIRTDDGSKASALLDSRHSAESLPPTGSTTASPKAPTKGNFVVQVSSLESSTDAQALKGKLASAGITNAFIDGPVTVNGKTYYRVRIGPFTSRESAVANQTRLRTLGYPGAYIQ